MPVSVVVGGQYGSEGKGKVALGIARDRCATIAVRPGGTNSGHTAHRRDGTRFVLRQLPAAAVDCQLDVIIPAGAYVDVSLLANEMAMLGFPAERLHIDPRAHIIAESHRRWEHQSDLTATIGSTGSGTGAAVLSRLARYAPGIPVGQPAAEVAALEPFIRDTVALMRRALDQGERIVVEGTQGFGLSPFHGNAWPKATSRDTTAAAFLSESGLAPADADEVVLVLRCHPIRVAGDSGPLIGETSWPEIAEASGGPWAMGEQTSVTGRLRRVGHFDPGIVRRAVAINQPTRIILNHLDQVDYRVSGRPELTDRAIAFVENVETSIGQTIDAVGVSDRHQMELEGARADGIIPLR